MAKRLIRFGLLMMSPARLCDIEAALGSTVISKYTGASSCELIYINRKGLKPFGLGERKLLPGG